MAPAVFVESPDTPWPPNAAPYTAFAVAYATERAIDLISGRYKRDRARWMQVTGYAHCQAFADSARAAKTEIILYASVRDPGGGMNLALLTGRAFAKREPTALRTWHIFLNASGAHAVCEAPTLRITFDRECFSADPRIAQMRWERGGVRAVGRSAQPDR